MAFVAEHTLPLRNAELTIVKKHTPCHHLHERNDKFRTGSTHKTQSSLIPSLPSVVASVRNRSAASICTSTLKLPPACVNCRFSNRLFPSTITKTSARGSTPVS